MASQMDGDTSVLDYKEVDKVFQKKWCVIFWNDDQTTFEFVIWLLMYEFEKTQAEAAALALTIHQSGSGIAGRYSLEVAETKAYDARQLARSHGYPLSVTVQEG